MISPRRLTMAAGTGHESVPRRLAVGGASGEDLAAQSVLAYDEAEYLAIQLKFRRDIRERVEAMLSAAADTR